MSLLIGIAMVWVVLALVCYLVLLYQSARPISEIDRFCTRLDEALRSQYGSGPSWIR